MEKPKCQYGDKCYRVNPSHFELFSHPDGQIGTSRGDETGESSVEIKKRKIDEMQPKNLKSGCKFGLFLTKVVGIENSFNSPQIAVDIIDILALDANLFEGSVQFNYMVDIPWLVSKYPKQNRTKPLLIVTGHVDVELRSVAHEFKNITLASAKLEMPYGTHHTKMMILKYKHGLRVVVHTANLIEQDWHQKTQGVWLSPLFPRNTTDTDDTPPGDSVTNFRADLAAYLKSYKLKHLDVVVGELDKCNFTEAKVFIVGSTPGRHVGTELNKWGHLKLRSLLKNHCDEEEEQVDKTWPLVGQFSSIGSLGASPESWLLDEFRTSLSAIKKPLATHPPLHLIYPTVENVRISLEGYPAGGSLPYSMQTAKKQLYLKSFMHQWKSDTFDEPWIVDVPHRNLADSNGNFWP